MLYEVITNVPDDPRFTFLNQNFRFLKNNLRFLGIETIDGLIADLGVSFHQFDTPDRGFTFRQDVRLDMRMNSRGKVTAASLLKNLRITSYNVCYTKLLRKDRCYNKAAGNSYKGRT